MPAWWALDGFAVVPTAAHDLRIQAKPVIEG